MTFYGYKMNRQIYEKFVRNCMKYSTSTMFTRTDNAEAGKFVLLSIPVITFGLGTWQIKRRSWKLKLIEEMKLKTTAAPIDLPDDLRNLKDLEYRKIRIKGKFDHSKEVYIGPRALVTEGGYYAGSKFQTTPESGNFVITPFHLADRDLSVLVNRGWVSKSKMKPENRLEGQIEGEISLVGLLRSSENKPIFSAKNNPSTNFFYFRDIEEIARKCDTAPVFIDADASSSVPGGPIGGQTRLTIRNEHLNYIVTWYSLSLLTAIMWYHRYWRKIRKPI